MKGQVESCIVAKRGLDVVLLNHIPNRFLIGRAALELRAPAADGTLPLFSKKKNKKLPKRGRETTALDS